MIDAVNSKEAWPERGDIKAVSEYFQMSFIQTGSIESGNDFLTKTIFFEFAFFLPRYEKNSSFDDEERSLISGFGFLLLQGGYFRQILDFQRVVIRTGDFQQMFDPSLSQSSFFHNHPEIFAVVRSQESILVEKAHCETRIDLPERKEGELFFQIGKWVIFKRSSNNAYFLKMTQILPLNYSKSSAGIFGINRMMLYKKRCSFSNISKKN